MRYADNFISYIVNFSFYTLKTITVAELCLLQKLSSMYERSWQRGLLHLEYLNQERFRSVLSVVRILLRFVRATVALMTRVQSLNVCSYVLLSIYV